MADTDVDYLQPDFDPRSVTMPRLRSIMVTHNIQYPSTAKKQDLVNLFNQEVAPMARKLLKQRARVKRMSSGIINAGDILDPEDDEDNIVPRPPSRSRSRRSASPIKPVSPRKSSSRLHTESVEPEYVAEPASTRTVRTTRRSASRGLSMDPEPIHATPSARRSRASMTPQVIVQEPTQPDDDDIPDMLSEAENEESVFTDDNPFQRSPPRAKTPGSTRRKSAGPGTAKRKSAGASSERGSPMGVTLSSIMAQQQQQQSLLPKARSPSAELGRIPSPAPSTQRNLSPSPVPRRSPSPGPFPEYQHDIDAGEEFTPEALQQLEADIAASGQSATASYKATDPSRKFDFATPLWVLLFTIFAAYGVWYRQEKIAVGYCGLGREPTQIIPVDVPVPDWIVPFIEPQCEPCPSHAYCYEDFVVRCEADFIMKPHPLSLGGLIPIPPTCQPDGEKAVRVKAVADKVIEELRTRRAEHECGGILNEDGEKQGSLEIKEQALKEIISRQRRKKLAQQEFDDLWDAAIGEVKTRDEVEITETDSGDLSDTYLSSTSLARLPVTCAIKRTFVKGLERHRFGIGAVVAVLVIGLYIRGRYRNYVATSAKIPALVDHVLDRLSKQKETADEEYDDPWLFLPNLRDDVLRSVHSLSERERIWVRVIRVVEQNANVRTAQRESRSGEVGRAWEWIGPVSSDMSGNRRKSGRTSYGVDTATSSSSVKLETPERAQWGEGKRPIY
ncbi:hypothetical protein CFIMG_004408RAa [Ceratocystis fimbriata CBS 114723]|uniref:Inner nuclear membrane protein SRC1 n=1 Tax=Ceratocystis fimbriata CBS 114723 TaxID=1035309 RepID=A0A2C5WTN9_9PEZI|nr:hypothetical protein CFIMG_004408RAa [Ceratocystis fimbriata CBS 114723]